MERFWKILFGLTGIIPVIFVGKLGTIALMYTAFVALYFLRRWIVPLVNRVPIPTYVLLLLFIWLTGLATETLFWSDVYVHGLADTPRPEEIIEGSSNPNLWVHLRNYIGFYGVKAIAWTAALWLFRFTWPQVFTTQGIIGFIVEQQFAILLGAIANPVVFVWLFYLAPVYSPLVVIPFLLLEERINQKPKYNGLFAGIIKYPFVLVLQLLLMMYWPW